jgi:hypothetical protein
VPLTVGEGDDDAVIPLTDGGRIRAGDYLFDAAVEAVLPEFVAGEEGSPPPEGIDLEQVNFEFASSPVFGPGSSSTFEAPFEEGHTYVALCFIQDREGGLHHAFQHGIFDVFQFG